MSYELWLHSQNKEFLKGDKILGDLLDILFNSVVKDYNQNNIPLEESESRTIKWMMLKDFIGQNMHITVDEGLAQRMYAALMSSTNFSEEIKKYPELRYYVPKYFRGGCNDIFNTQHEFIFSEIFPLLKQQQSFGTGKGGYKKYGVKRYIADFVDPIAHVIIEIDGKNHSTYLQKIKDDLRTHFFQSIDYLTFRFTNEEVKILGKIYCNTIALIIQNKIRSTILQTPIT